METCPSGPDSDKFPLENPIQIVPLQPAEVPAQCPRRSVPPRASTPIMGEASAAPPRHPAEAAPRKKRARRKRRFPPHNHQGYTNPPTALPRFRTAQAAINEPPAQLYQDQLPATPDSTSSATSIICILTQRPSRWQITPLHHQATPWPQMHGNSFSARPTNSWSDSGSGCFYGTNGY